MTGPASMPRGLERQFALDLPAPERGDRAIVWLGGTVYEGHVMGPAVIRHANGGEVPAFRVHLYGRATVLPADRVTGMSRLDGV